MTDLRTLSQLADEFDVSEEWLSNLAKDGDIPCLLAGNQMLFSVSAVCDALASRAANWSSPLQYLNQVEVRDNV